MVDVKIKIALVLIAILILAAPIAIAQEVPPHVVISEVYPNVNTAYAHSEWIELYNPTAKKVNIAGWSIDTAATRPSDATIPTGAIIHAHGFYLIADEDFSTEKDDPLWPDADFEEAITLTDGNGWCRLNDSGNFVDTVGWGTATTNETQNAVKPAKGKSIERKPLGGSYAPCQDTDDNSADFDEPGTPTPKNSLSPEMEPAPVKILDSTGDLKGSFVNIQDAVDNASDGYTIRVDNGTYEENVDVDKQLTICSEYGAAVTTVSASDPDDNVIAVTVDNVTITGFNVAGATQKAGISLDNVDYCNIANNSASNNCVTDSDTANTTVLFKELNCICGDICVNETGWWQDGSAFIASGTPIQDAIDNAIAGETICVKNGMYHENVNVYKRLTIRSENGAASTSVQGASLHDYVFEVTADYVTISGFHVTSASKVTSGIYLYGANYCNISDNIANEKFNHGIFLNSSSNNTLVNNTASHNDNDGIYLYQDSNNNYLINNTASDNKGDGFKLESNSNHNRIIGNNASDNDNNGIRLYGTTGNPSSHNTVASNTADRNAESGIMIVGADSDYNTIVNNTCKSNDYGISIRYGDYNNLTNNICNQNTVYGIRLYRFADNNEITNNTAISNNVYGINISSSDYNIIYNNYFDNTHNAWDNGNNIWNTTKTLGTNIIGGQYLGGNNWSDYAGRDLNGDGLGDTLLPYNSSGDITNDGDYHPLVPVGYAPVLSIEKTDNPDPVSPGGTLNYTISVNNTGSATATNVTVTETYDANVTFASAVPAPSGGNDTWIFRTLNVSEMRWINISATVNSSTLNRTVLHNSVIVSCNECDTVTATEDTKVFTTFAPPKITSFAPSSPVNDTVDAWRTFNVTVNQTVDIEWYLDDSLNQTNNSVREASFKLQAEEGEHNVTATASNENGSDSHSWIWNVKSISVTKVGDVTEAAPSTLVNFNITVINTGDSNLTQVVVKDELPEGMIYKSSVSDANMTQDGMDITWYFNESLAVNASKTIKLVAQIEEDAEEGVLTNTVNVTGTPETGDKVYDEAKAEVRVIRIAIKKSCKSSTTSLGKTVEYTITYSNPNMVNLTNVVITEHYPKILTFTSAVPAPDPGTNNKWTIGTLPTGETGTIKIKMKVPASMTDFSYEESGSVSGEGIVMISKELSTKVEPFDLENIVTISGSYGATNVNATASAITTVGVSGSSLEITEHGSGLYKSEEELSVSPEKMGIKFDKTTNAEYSPTTFKCSDGFVMEVPSKWSQDICIRNYVKKSAIHKTITEATYMNDNTIINTDNKVYSMKFDSTFLGYLHVDKKTKDTATSEHYIGEFVITSWDQSGKEIVEGEGYVIVDKELSSGRLLLMEHGSGYYLSEEDSSSNSIKKITVAEYEPTSFNFSDGFVVNFSSKWMQDICARSTTGTSALHKKIRDATFIDDDTIARSSPSLIFETFFYGATHVGSKSGYSKASEDYIGDFYISWGASSIFIFDWDDVPGPDNDDLIDHLSEPKFNMSWVKDDDVEITKSSKKDKITISTPEHSAEIILDTETDESAELIVDGVDTYTFNVVKHGKTLKVYDPEFKRKPELVTGEGFVMVDEAIFRDGEIEVTEHGSGIYHSEEAFNSKSIEKETYGEYKPTYFSFSDSFSVNFSSLWMQDICVKDKAEGTAIHKKISDAALMKDDTIAAKSLMNITSSFNGSMHIGARTEKVSISEDYIGEFNVTELIKIVKGKPPKSSSESPNWLFCPCPISSSTYLWFCQDPTYRRRWLSGCPYPYKDNWLYIHP